MPQATHGEDGPERGGGPELFIRITVPEEFTGFATDQVNAAHGMVRTIEAEQGATIIVASVPHLAYGHVAKEIASATLGRGKVERTDT